MKKSFSATFDNLKNIRSMLVDFLNNHKLQVKEIKEIELGTDEAVTNIIKHSYKEENKKNIIEVELEFSENKVIIHLYDNGTPVNEEKIKPRELSDVKPGGLGTYFINKIMDEVRWKKSDKWVNHLTLIKNINI
jgi:serine/threonine-protein kinase RsbW